MRRVSRPYARRAEPVTRTVAFGGSVAAVLLSAVGALGAGPNAPLADATPLSLACTSGNGAMVERLLAAGADPNAALPGGETPLMTASRVGSSRQ